MVYDDAGKLSDAYYQVQATIIRAGQSVCGNASANIYGNINNTNGLSVSTTGPTGSDYTISGQSGLPSGFHCRAVHHAHVHQLDMDGQCL